MRLSLLARRLHQAEGVKVRESLLVVAVDVDLRIDGLANVFLGPNSHGSLHAGVRNVWHDV